MLTNAILYPVVVAFLIAGGVLAWFSGAGLWIVAVLAVLVVGAVVRDLTSGRRHAVANPELALPPEGREESDNPEADGLPMQQVEDELHASSKPTYLE